MMQFKELPLAGLPGSLLGLLVRYSAAASLARFSRTKFFTLTPMVKEISQARGDVFPRFILQHRLRLTTGEVPHHVDTGTVEDDGWVDAGQTMAISFWRISDLLNFTDD